jgi:hypothetical protein
VLGCFTGEQTFESVDGFALDQVRDGAVVECRVGFSNLPTATLVADLDLMRDPEVEHVDIKAARRRRTSALVIERRTSLHGSGGRRGLG